MNGKRMKSLRDFLGRVLLALALATISMANASPAADTPLLTIIDEAGKPHEINAKALAELPRRKLHATAHGRQAEFEGVVLADLLAHAGVEFGDRLKGRGAPTVAVCEATDGYRVAFAMAELDTETADRLVLVADRRDGRPLAGDEGPLRLVVPDDKRPLRWIRMLRTIRILNLQDADLRQPVESEPVAE